jgi:glycosyltransferase involved in cell wall biosynthesis
VNLYGEGAREGDAQRISAYADELELSGMVKIHAPVYDEAKIAALAQADLFLLPSHHEGMPLSILEGMAAGLPVVATRVGGIVDQVVEGQTGFLVPPEAPDDLARAMEGLIEDRDLRLRQGMAGRERACQHFDIQIKAKALLAFFEAVLTRRN